MYRSSLHCLKVGFMNSTFHTYFASPSLTPIITDVTTSMIVCPASDMLTTPCWSMTTTHTPVCGARCFSVRYLNTTRLRSPRNFLHVWKNNFVSPMIVSKSPFGTHSRGTASSTQCLAASSRRRPLSEVPTPMIDIARPCAGGLLESAGITIIEATGGGGCGNGNKTTPTPRHHHLV